MTATHQPGKHVFVRLSGRLGHVLGLSDNPAHAASDEPVYHVRYDDDGTTVHAAHSSLGEPKADEAAAEASEETPEAKKKRTPEAR